MSDYIRTPNLQLYKPTYKADGEQWGDHLNWNADTLDTVLGPAGIAARFAVINVLDHGALGNGTTDDTSAIQGALTTYAGKATVYIPDTGNPYMVNVLSPPSGTTLVIDGTLKLRPGNSNGVLTPQNVSNITISGHGTIDGNGTAAQAGITAGINAGNCTHVRISGITIQNVGSATHGGWSLNITGSTDVVVDGIRSLNSQNACEFAAGSDRCWITNSLIDGNHNDFGFSFYGGVTNSGIIGCTVTNTAGGIFVLSDSGQPAPCRNLLIANNICYSNFAFGIAADTAVAAIHDGITISSNRCYGNNAEAHTGQSEIWIDHTNAATISDNLISCGEGGINPTGRGIGIGAAAANVSVTGNNIYNIGSGTEAGTGVYVTASAGPLTISGNTFYDFRAPAYMTSSISGTAGPKNAYIGNNCNAIPLTVTRQPDTVYWPNAGGGVSPINAANDAAAASAGVAIGGAYRNGSVLMVRVA